MNPDDFQKKVSIRDPLTGEIESECGVSGGESTSSTVGSGVASQTLVLLRSLLEIQQRRAQAYAKLKRFGSFFLQTVTIQVLKKAGRPSERMLTHENCKFKKPMQHECVHLHEITEAAGTEEAEADAKIDNPTKILG